MRTAIERFRRGVAASRAHFVEGTPEKYPLAAVRGVSISDAETILKEREQLLVEIERLRRQRDEAADALEVMRDVWERQYEKTQAVLADTGGEA